MRFQAESPALDLDLVLAFLGISFIFFSSLEAHIGPGFLEHDCGVLGLRNHNSFQRHDSGNLDFISFLSLKEKKKSTNSQVHRILNSFEGVTEWG